MLQVTMGMNLTLAIALAGFVILAYTAMGGLKAVIYTDVLQMVVLLIGIIFLLVPIGLIRVGGWSGLAGALAAAATVAGLLTTVLVQARANEDLLSAKEQTEEARDEALAAQRELDEFIETYLLMNAEKKQQQKKAGEAQGD